MTCVLVKQGGAVLLKDGSAVLLWAASEPGKVQRVKSSNFLRIEHTEEDAVIMRSNDFLFVRIETNKTALAPSPPKIDRVFSTAVGPWFALTTTDGQSLAYRFDGLQVQQHIFPFSKAHHLAIVDEKTGYATDSAGTLLTLSTDGTSVIENEKHTQLRKIIAWGKGLLMITSDERVEGLNLDETVPPLQGVTDLLTGDGFAIARDTKNKLTIWGSKVPDSPQRMSMPAGTTRLTASPLGLIAAW